MNPVERLRRIPPEWPLRIGLGLMYLYSGTSLIREPAEWVGFLPQWFTRFVSAVIPLNTYLAIQGLGELVIALFLLVWFLPRWVARLAAIAAVFEILFIIIFVGIDLVTFRDLGLLGGALTLLILIFRRREVVAAE